MSEFEKWFKDQDFYTNMRFIHGDKLFDKDGDVYRVLPVQMTYQGWSTQRQRSKDEFVELTQEWHTKGWNARQAEIDELQKQVDALKVLAQTFWEKSSEKHKQGKVWESKSLGECADEILDELEQALKGGDE